MFRVLYVFVISDLFLTICATCPKFLSVNITDGYKEGENITQDGITFSSQNYFVENSSIYGCVCNIKNCVRKCCENDSYLNNGVCSFKNGSQDEDFVFYNLTKPYGKHVPGQFIIHGRSCESKMLQIRLDGEFYLQTNGSLYGLDLSDTYIMYSTLNYCLDYSSDEQRIQAFICISEKEADDVDNSRTIGSVHILFK
ncbi:unnamed protein product [Diabrotica balteata]|uniref:Methuselah N-terminal domain-containing protein n=1 Tax=Diabrotica balteata TaxID=107213 RepID=A0A9N9TCQ4_DIABA|nr:unnamed protein product [Diabrotica balteata]